MLITLQLILLISMALEIGLLLTVLGEQIG